MIRWKSFKLEQVRNGGVFSRGRANRKSDVKLAPNISCIP
jgi:hypothetical protein